MEWRDFLYFSRGERRALSLLTGLLTITFFLLLWNEREAEFERILLSEVEQASIMKDSIYSSQSLPPPPTNSPDKATRTIPRSKKKQSFQPSKLPQGSIVELNSADTTLLKKVPGIGSVFANRIVKYRNLLGGFYSVDQLREVYGMDEDRINQISPWFVVDTGFIQKIYINQLDSLPRHPYLTYKQRKSIERLLHKKSTLPGWEELLFLEEFSQEEFTRLYLYISFE